MLDDGGADAHPSRTSTATNTHQPISPSRLKERLLQDPVVTSSSSDDRTAIHLHPSPSNSTTATPATKGRKEHQQAGRRRRRRWSTSTAGQQMVESLGYGRRPFERRAPSLDSRSHAKTNGSSNRRSLSQAIYRAVAGETDSEEEGGEGEHLFRRERGDDDASSNQYHQHRHRRGSRSYYRGRTSSTMLLAQPSSFTEAFSAFAPGSRRVSAIIRSARPPPLASPTSTTTTTGLVQSASHDDDDDDIHSLNDSFTPATMPYGVKKMEVLAKYVSSRGMLFCSIYLITLFTSMSSTTTPTVEPFLISLFGGHSYISSIAIVTSVGRCPSCRDACIRGGGGLRFLTFTQ